MSSTINSNGAATPVLTLTQKAPPAAAPAPAAAAPVATDNVSISSRHPIDEKNFSWSDLGKGLAGSVVGGAVDGVLMTGTAYKHLPSAAVASFKGLYETPQIGPWLKGTLTPVLVAATVAAVALTPLVAVGYGIYSGFVHGAEENPSGAAKEAVKDAGKFSEYAKADLSGAISSFAETPLPAGKKAFDITPLDAGKALISGTAGAVIDGVGIGASTIAHIPNGLVEAVKELHKGNAALPLKVGAGALIVPAIPLTAGLGVIGGAAAGFGLGVRDGYTKGIEASVKQSFETVKEFNNFAKETTKAPF